MTGSKRGKAKAPALVPRRSKATSWIRPLIIAGAWAGLAGCSGEPGPNAETTGGNAAVGAENLAAAEPNQAAIQTVTDAPASDPDAPISSESGAAIPAAFHGRWGMAPADCTSTRGDAKGLLVIDEASLGFYESRAIPRNIELTGPTEWRAELDYSGEGQTWSETTTVTLLNGGKTLRRMGDGPWTYQRCETTP